MKQPWNHPALNAFCQFPEKELQLGQILIIPLEDEERYEIRHASDRNASLEDLQNCNSSELRGWVATDALGRFRPLKSAPSLRRGWRHECDRASGLWEALSIIYPGAIGDWFASQREPSPLVSFRSFVDRQTGMYRGAAKLSRTEAEQLTAVCCADRHCLKSRYWPIETEDPPPSPPESRLVCLEPCQLLLELARRRAKTALEPTLTFKLPKSEAQSIIEALKTLAKESSADHRVADFSDPQNPRRLHLLLDQLESQFPRQTEAKGE